MACYSPNSYTYLGERGTGTMRIGADRRVGLKNSRDCDDRILERRNGDSRAAGAARTVGFVIFAFLITAAPGVELERSATFYADN